MTISRRTVLSGALGGAGLVALSGPSVSSATGSAPSLLTRRSTLPSGVQAGDVTTRSAVLWSRSDRPGRMIVKLSTGGRGGRRREIAGPWATPVHDNTAKVRLDGLRPNTEYTYRIQFEDHNGSRGEVGVGHFVTADPRHGATSFAWTGDTAGQGWGINPDLGGMTAYSRITELHPDFFIHSGDNIYADNPIKPEVVEPDGQVWHNIVTPEVSKVAETLNEFRGRYRYNLMDDNVRELYASTCLISQGDDHEVHNNWFPGQILTDDRYTERRVDVLAARARQAFFEYMPIDERARGGRREEERVYRKIPRGGHIDVFALDMRKYRGPNTPDLETERVPFLGAKQVDWLLKELDRSTATWKLIAADMPIGLVVPDGPVNIEAIANRDPGQPLGREIEMAYLLSQIKRRGIRNVVWLTADVHYSAVHYYDPAKAAFKDFDPFYEFVTGPISAGAFGPNELDATFGPTALFQGLPRYQNQSPRDGKAMFFGYGEVDRSGELSIQIVDGTGAVRNTTVLDPA